MPVLCYECPKCPTLFATTSELKAHVKTCKGYDPKSKVKKNTAPIVDEEPVILSNPSVLPEDIAAEEKAEEEVVEVEKAVAEEAAGVSQEVEEIVSVDVSLREELLTMGNDSLDALKEWGKAHGVDKRKVNNKSVEEAVDIILANKE